MVINLPTDAENRSAEDRGAGAVESFDRTDSYNHAFIKHLDGIHRLIKCIHRIINCIHNVWIAFVLLLVALIGWLCLVVGGSWKTETLPGTFREPFQTFQKSPPSREPSQKPFWDSFRTPLPKRQLIKNRTSFGILWKSYGNKQKYCVFGAKVVFRSVCTDNLKIGKGQEEYFFFAVD